MKKLLLSIMLVVSLFLIPSISFSEDGCQTVRKLQDTGLIMEYNFEYNEIIVNPVVWSLLELRVKENFLYIASSCSKQSGHVGVVNVIDGYSGKKLAKVGAFGPKFY
jgi:hypothetical protein